ncbi:MAG: M1 family metallopeptidase [Planctomycetota bacterium]|jgi:hypothetical protein
MMYQAMIQRFPGALPTLLVLIGLGLASGCSSTRPVPMRAVHYDLDIELSPETHAIEARAAIELERVTISDGDGNANGGNAIRINLHPDLNITDANINGQPVRIRTVKSVAEDEEFQPAQYDLQPSHIPDSCRLTIAYGGELFQDVSAGEALGAIHNLGMRAHIAPEGIYLAGGAWYPHPEIDDEVAQPATFAVVADRVEGLELAGSGDNDEALASGTDRLAWRTPYPVDHFAVVGGPHEIHTRDHGDVEIVLHLKPEQSAHVEGLFKTAGSILDRYEPLVGAYPARTFRIVDNFFSSGFAFPTFTLLSSAVIDMGERSQTAHGYIDHEMLHCWWGNGILVDPADGNWCESITSFATNYYGYVLDGKPEEARRKRRNYVHFLSRLDPEKDKPLSTYGTEDGCGRGIAYNKGAAVFQMLAHKMGRDRFFEAMRNFTARYVGKYANWEDIRAVCEEVHGGSLEPFFTQWVRGSGAPMLTVSDARFNTSEQKLSFTLSQAETAFDLDVPVRVYYDGGHRDIHVTLDRQNAHYEIPFGLVPRRVEVDPDYEVFRKVLESDIIPTTNTTRAGDRLLTLLPAGEVAQKYLDTQEKVFEESFEEEEFSSAEVTNASDSKIAQHSLLVLGEAVQHEAITRYLASVDGAPTFSAGGFRFMDKTYSTPEFGLLCTITHPDVSQGGITVVFGNSEEAIPNPGFIPFYDRSLVIFENGRPIVRHDFEPRHLVDVIIE